MTIYNYICYNVIHYTSYTINYYIYIYTLNYQTILYYDITYATNKDSLRGSIVQVGTILRILAWPLRKDDTHKSRGVNNIRRAWIYYNVVHHNLFSIHCYTLLCSRRRVRAGAAHEAGQAGRVPYSDASQHARPGLGDVRES